MQQSLNAHLAVHFLGRLCIISTSVIIFLPLGPSARIQERQSLRDIIERPPMSGIRYNTIFNNGVMNTQAIGHIGTSMVWDPVPDPPLDTSNILIGMAVMCWPVIQADLLTPVVPWISGIHASEDNKSETSKE
ncbi:hypothetical protein IW261DRAFT_1421815 [Armillaria novae-zelandiae]|uniref:Uncharacterized protein n=1 Tax=Armillaria novae-zelandiae TaxID=153914 RepID=A0AA39TAG2_9AGAR|nr:hypothetical protein IW261DRAFT_1421815 [Armillaria novae-zelandiae]